MHKQWAAGAPVIGAAPVPSGRPKRLFRLTGIRRVERSNFFLKTISEKGNHITNAANMVMFWWSRLADSRSAPGSA
jgi:hypothetical protein